MTLTSLFTETISHLRHGVGVEDEYGNVSDTYAPAVDVKGRLEQRSSVELTQDRQTVISDWVLFLFPDVVVDEQDRFVDAYGRTFEVVGAPAMRSAPRGSHHLEVSLRHVAS